MKIRIIYCLSLMLVLGSVAVAQCGSGRPSVTASVNWPQYQFDTCHTGYNPYESVLNVGNVGSLTVRWKAEGVSLFAPAVANGMAYFGSPDGVYALNARTGALVWMYPIDSGAQAPMVDGGNVYVSGEYGRSVYALNAKTGALVWQYTAASYVTTPTIAYGLAYVGSYDYKLYALDASTGELRWTHTTGGEVTGVAVASGAYGPMVYFGSNDGYVYAANALNGSSWWSYKTGGGVLAGPSVANGAVYAGSRDGYLYAIDANFGWLYWKYTTGGQYAGYSSPAIFNGVLYIGAQWPQGLYALNAFTGEQLWYDQIYAFFVGPPVVANGVVYLGCQDNAVYVIDASTGAILWQRSGAYSSAVATNSLMYISTYNGDGLYAFGLPNQ